MDPRSPRRENKWTKAPRIWFEMKGLWKRGTGTATELTAGRGGTVRRAAAVAGQVPEPVTCELLREVHGKGATPLGSEIGEGLRRLQAVERAIFWVCLHPAWGLLQEEVRQVNRKSVQYEGLGK